jgi:fatty-acyl-CoA synthase
MKGLMSSYPLTLPHLADRVAKWWIPDQVEFLDEVPKTSVGKFSKKTLRERFAG